MVGKDIYKARLGPPQILSRLRNRPTATILGAQSARSMAESNVVPASVKNALLASKKADDAQAAVALAVRAAFQPHSSSAFDPITQLALAGALNTDGSVNLELVSNSRQKPTVRAQEWVHSTASSQ